MCMACGEYGEAQEPVAHTSAASAAVGAADMA